MNTNEPIKLHVSAYGPKSRALTAKLGAGWLNFVGDVDTGVSAMSAMAQSWADAGRSSEPLEATAFLLGCVLAEGEPLDSPRVMAQSGPRAAVLLHRAADVALSGLPNTSAVPPSVADVVNAYVEFAQSFEPADAKYLENHRGHLMVLKPEERQFVTPELIQSTTFTGTEDDILTRFEALRAAGYTQLTVQLTPGQEDAVEDWGRLFKRFNG